MKYECKVIEDLLPLYKDGICSEESKKAVEEHLNECPECRKMLDELNDTKIDEMIAKEKDNVIDSQSKFFKRKSALAGSIIAGVFAIPILICLIVDLATGNGLGWFFIVLAAMFIPTSLLVVPLMVTKNKMFTTMCSFTGSLIFLLGVIALYKHGSWFFIAAPAVLFGLTVVFGPFIVIRRPVKEYLGNYKGLTLIAAYTVTFFGMLTCIGIFGGGRGFFPTAYLISVPIVAFVWLVFAIIRYAPANGLLKTGVIIMLINAFGLYGPLLIVNLITRFTNETVYANSDRYGEIVLWSGLAVGAVLTIIGLIIMLCKGNKERNNG